MIRNLKIPALALAAALALVALMSSAASAQTQGKIKTDAPSLTLDGVEDGANILIYPGLEGVVECPGSTITGHKVASTPHVAIPVESSDATVTPKFVNCHNGAHLVTVTTNGCDFVYHIGSTTVGVSDTYALTVDVVCPAGQVIEFHVYLASGNSNTTICTIKVPAQSGITGSDIANELNAKGETTDTLTVTGAPKNIKASREGLCGASETSAAEQTINYTLTGTNTNEGHELTGVTITDS